MKKVAKKKLEANIISEQQFCRTMAVIKKIEKEEFITKEVKNVTEDDIQNYLNSLKNYSNSEIKKVYEQFNQAYKYLINFNLIKVNPMLRVYKPKSTKKEREVRALTLEEEKVLVRKLTNNSDKLYSLVALIQLFTGMRVSEVLALTINDINFQNNEINIDKTLSRNLHSKIIIKNSTKTKTSNRIIPIPRMIKKGLKEREKIAVKNNEIYLFLNRNGHFLDARDFNIFLKSILENSMDTKEISSHNLRHTYITRCAESGMNPKVLMKLVGHKDIETTLGTYTTIYDNYTKSEMNKIQNYYKKNKLLIGEISRIKSNNWLKNDKLKESKNKIKIFKYQIKQSLKDLFSA
jgi:integrase